MCMIPPWFRLLLLCCLLPMLPLWPASAQTAVAYRAQAERCVKAGDYQSAAVLYRKEAAIYRKIGDVNAAKAEEMKAERWTTELALFRDVPVSPADAPPYRLAKYEPRYGCYLGAFVERDDMLKRMVENDRSLLSPAVAFGKLVAKPLALCFTYRVYGVDFPLDWALALTKHGIAPHIAWEPNHGLGMVKNDDYLRRFAADAAAVGGPVFIRFAGEMNGKWTRYHDNPELYKQKFRLVHDVMAKLAPNVAMIWCVNQIPEYNITQYYPGDDYVDWVGVNCYSVFFHDNNRNRPAEFENPSSYLTYVYQQYSARKPIAICEYGVTHMAALDRVERQDFAATKWAQMLAALPRRFPRIKMINAFNCNTMIHALPARQLNNYCVTDNETVLTAFRQAIAPAYYLSHIEREHSAAASARPEPLISGTTLTGTCRVSAWVKSYTHTPRVTYSLDKQTLAVLCAPGTYAVELNTAHYPPGKHVLTVTVTDSRGKQAAQKSLMLIFAPAAAPVAAQ